MVATITAVIGTTIAVITFIVGVFQYRRTVHMNIFRTYADKYNSIVTADIYDKWQSALNGTQDQIDTMHGRIPKSHLGRVLPLSFWRNPTTTLATLAT